MVRAVRQPDLSGGQRHRRAARRSAAGERRVPGVERLAEDFVVGVAAGAEFRCVRLGEHDAATRLDPVDQRMRGFWNMVGMDRRAIGGPDPLDIHEVLDRDRQSSEPAARVAAGQTALFGKPPRVITGPLGTKRWQGVHRRLDRVDAGERRVDQF